MKKTIIIISAILVFLITGVLIFSANAPVSVDKFIYDTFIRNESNSEFSEEIYNRDFVYITNEFCRINKKHPLDEECIYGDGFGHTTSGEITSITYDGNKVFASLYMYYEDDLIKLDFEGTRKWYFTYEWKMLYNENFPDLQYKTD